MRELWIYIQNSAHVLLTMFWLGFSLASYHGGEGILFQRAGSLGVLAAFSPALHRLREEVLLNKVEGLQSKSNLLLISKKQSDHYRDLAKLTFRMQAIENFSITNTKLIMASIKPDSKDLGQELLDAATEMSEIQSRSDNQRFQLNKIVETKITDNSQFIEETHLNIQKKKQRLFWQESLIVILGTIQWGFGDLLVS